MDTFQHSIMKKTIFVSLCFLCLFTTNLIAQDVILLIKGDVFECKITDMNELEVSYTFISAPNVKYTLKKSEVKNFFFGQTMAQVFNFQMPPQNATKADSTENIVAGQAMYWQGIKDARLYYRNYSNAGTGVFLTTFLFGGIGGFITAVGCADQPPKTYNLGFPNAKLMENASYKRGYITTAHQKKKNKVWNNFGAGLITLVAFLVIVSN